MLAGEQVRLRGVDGGDEWVSQKDAAQGVEGVDAVLPGRGDISADTAEVHEGVKAAEGAGDLLPQLHHSQITLREVMPTSGLCRVEGLEGYISRFWVFTDAA